MPDLDTLLEETSRTFALSIPLLPDPTRREVTVAYLLFRIADTFEDTTSWPRQERIGALEAFCRVIEGDGADAASLARRWSREVPVDHAGYRQLLADAPHVLDELAALRPEARDSIRRHLVRTARGMAGYVERTGQDGELRLEGLQDLRDYCYVVAGIVGEMLTELFLLGRQELEGEGPYLRERAATFGEGLQLVNVLKDSARDARQGRIYLPEVVDREEVFRIARQDLDRAAEYILALQQAEAEPGLVAFNALPVRLAWATLDVVKSEGPGSKISRPVVWSEVESLEKALEEGRPAVRPPA